ncbi:reverse transcriptase [Cucumis melo var. makuwa]|uniref:Reverse transcriptase n=1 Tax=Cucumis melo var. makuwa TaxID=1194695 RepID=A0A5D3BLS9_CUCMM|nr:reverse transcriptase [Cucumis melo var. makuwa]
MVVSFKTTLLMSSYPVKKLFIKVPVLTPLNKVPVLTPLNKMSVPLCCQLLSLSISRVMPFSLSLTSSTACPLVSFTLQTLLDYLKESYPSMRLIPDVSFRVFECTTYVHSHGPNQTKFTPRAQACMFVGYPLHQRGYKYFHPSSQSICPTVVTLPNPSSHTTVLLGNQVPWKTYYRRNLRKRVKSHVVQTTLVQNSKPIRDQGENDRSATTVLKDMEMKALEKNNTWRFVLYPRDISLWDANGCSLSNTKQIAHLTNRRQEEVYMSSLASFKAQFIQQAEICQLKQRMGNEFEMKDLGNLKYFLEMEVTRFKEGISVSQRKYILDLLTETSMLRCRLVDTPIEFNCKVRDSDNQVQVDKEQYHCLMESLPPVIVPLFGAILYLGGVRNKVLWLEAVLRLNIEL